MKKPDCFIHSECWNCREESKSFNCSVADVLENSISANSETLHKIVLRELSVLGDDVSKLSSVVTDEASVKAGKLSVHDSDMNFSHSFLFTEFDIDWHQHVLSLVIKQHISWRYLNTWGNYGSFLRTLLRELQF